MFNLGPLSFLLTGGEFLLLLLFATAVIGGIAVVGYLLVRALRRKG